MLKRAFEKGLAILDLCWPFPLGIAFGVLVVGASTGAWLMLREPATPRRAPLRTNTPPPAMSPAPSEVAPPAPEPAAPAPTRSTIPADAPPAKATKTSPASAASQSDRATAGRPLTAQEAKLLDTLTRARWYMKQGQYRAAIEEFQAALEMDPSNAEARTGLQQARVASGNPEPGPQPDRATVSRPPTAQDAKLRDTLTRARWYMKQGQYRPAIEEFQAVLALDPSNREARAGLQQARDASGNSERGPQP